MAGYGTTTVPDAVSMPPPTSLPGKASAKPVPTLQAEAREAADENTPRKRINSPHDLDTFTKSKLCQQLGSFTGELAEAAKGLPITADRRSAASPLVKALAEMLDEIERWVEEFPPLAQPMRFGNKAFRQWHGRLCERSKSLLREALGHAGEEHASKVPALAAELSHYLNGAFGDDRRIDYGTGHEVAFLAIIFALGARGLLARTDAADAVLVVFATYVRVMRRLQTVYMLEPAGSHGVWGLDDYHMLPFLFGAAQLVGKEDEVPTGQVYKEQIVKEYADQYLYVDAIRQVLLAKKGAPFHETSPMLYDISSVPDWQKTQNGLMKMFRAEVLGKYPVIQHFLFGPTIPWPGDSPS
eukprot:TRINITY_DN28453_c0_g1_i1.p1 TRINITY_DN28453_c0_g1~~TRINITY_DN28453_c0_g1_i1.p1  ORF type:complete len:355 (-),score=80.02 TRINITY_DN28453_c0_g1_i1:55-1119(-)